MGIKAINLTCEYIENAKGVNTQSPFFGWKLISDVPGDFQSAYRIIATDAKENIFWDSGKVESASQFGIEMNVDQKLLPMEFYYFKVMVWDKNDNLSNWSDTSFFHTGFFKVHQWKADWFRVSYGTANFWRKEFQIENVSDIDYAYLYCGAVGEKMNSCATYINGERVGNDAIFPGATEYFKAMYCCIDCLSYLKNGMNAIGIVVEKTSSLILKIKYKDGKENFIYTQYNEWKHKKGGPFVALGYYPCGAGGKFEDYDAQKSFKGWTEPGFNDIDWDIEVPLQWVCWGPLLLEPQYCTTKIQKSYKPANIIKYDDCWFVDFGTNMAGFVSISFKGKAGERIEIKFAEKLNNDCSRGEITEWQPCLLKYTFATDEIEQYTPTFMHTGFRCVEIYGFSGQVTEDNIVACSIHSNVLNNSHFECSSDIINQMNEIARKSFLSNLVNIPTDCPERERRGWTADSFAVCEAECVNFNMLNFFYQWFDSMKDCQRSNGWIPVELPLSTDDSVDINWPAACVLIPYDLFIQYGDERFIKRYFSMMTSWVELLEQISDDDYSMCDSFLSFKDWLAIEVTTSNFIAMAYFYRCASLLSLLAKIINQMDDAKRYGYLAQKIRENIDEKFLHIDGCKVYYDNGSQSANAHALFFNICPEQYKEQVTQSLVDDIQIKNASTTGFLGTMCLMQALSQNGRDDVAYSLLMNRNLGGWIYLIENCNATTFPENYDGDGSQNHAFLGSSPGLWIYKYLVGISPIKPGYKEVRIKPYIPEDMDYAQASIETIYGDIFVRWEKNEGKIDLSVNLPPNVNGIIELFDNRYSIESGKHYFSYFKEKN